MSTEIFRLEGEFWTVTFEGLTVRVRDAKGMRYLAHLLARPNESIGVAALSAAALGYGPGNRRADPEGPAALSPADRERLRSAVAKRVRAAIARLAEYDPALGHFLTATVHTGYACSHHPDPGRPVHWDCSPSEPRGGAPPSPLSGLQTRRTSMAMSRSSVRLAIALTGLLLPVPALADLGAVVATGETHSCATTLARTVECRGDNSMGHLGNDFLLHSHTPVEVSGLQNVYALAVGAAHACATDGAARQWCWGMNNAGQVGDGTTTNRSTPVQVVLPGYVSDVAAGDAEQRRRAVRRDATRRHSLGLPLLLQRARQHAHLPLNS